MGLSSKVKIRTTNGMHLMLGNITGKHLTRPKVYSYVECTGQIDHVCATISSRSYTEQILRITMETGESIGCTGNYLFMLDDFSTFRQAYELKPLDKLAGMMWKPNNDIPYREEVLKHSLTVSEIRPIKYHGSVYNVYVPTLDNFAVEVGERVSVFVHSGERPTNEPISTEV